MAEGVYEKLVERLEKELADAEGGWQLDERKRELTIHTTISRDPSRSRTGGEYDFYICFQPTADGVVVYDATSCELRIDWMEEELYPVLLSLNGLRRLAALLDLRGKCAGFLRRKNTFSELRAAVEAAA